MGLEFSGPTTLRELRMGTDEARDLVTKTAARRDLGITRPHIQMEISVRVLDRAPRYIEDKHLWLFPGEISKVIAINSNNSEILATLYP